MPKKKDENETAFDALQEILRRDRKRDGLPVEPTKKEEKMPCRVESGRKGGKMGGIARSEKLTAKQKKEIAQKAARSRWAKERSK